jgi:carboxyl-terminal processing protease
LSYLSPYVFAKSSIKTTSITDEDMEKYQRVEEVLHYIKENYIGEIDEDAMVEGAIKGLVEASGDKYATYFNPEEAQQFYQENEGEYGGIGVVVNIDQDKNILTVSQVYKNSPAEEAGFLPGDIIYKVDGMEVIGLESTEVVYMVKGEPGTDVVITVLRGSEEIDMPLTRAIIIAERAEWYMTEGNIGYIQLIEFNGNCADLFHQAIKELTEQGMEGLILDLRYNPGGDKGIVVDIADTLLPKGPIITLIDNKGNRQVDSSDAQYLGIPLVVLVNEHSASASELLSGAIQDYDGIGVVIGETTYGKGVAQGFFSHWSDGALLRLTTSKYLTPSGACPQDVGIIPDIEVILVEEVVNNPALLTTEKDNQMQKAIDVVKDIITGEYTVH